MALGVSALGKKKHRVEVARRLVFGSVVASFETQKNILYPAALSKNALFRVLDSSLPWWTDRDPWGRWACASQGTKDSNYVPKLGLDSQFCLATDSEDEVGVQLPTMAFSEAIQKLTSDPSGQSTTKRSSIIAMYLSLLIAG